MVMPSPLHTWAIPQIQNILPLDEETALQVVDQSLKQGSPDAIAEYWNDFLGHSPDALSFIKEFNSRNTSIAPKPSSKPSTPSITSPQPPKHTAPSPSKRAWSVADGTHATKIHPQKPRANLAHRQELRKANEGAGGASFGPGKVYMKKEEEEEYFTGLGKSSKNATPRGPTPTSNIAAQSSLTQQGGGLVSSLPLSTTAQATVNLPTTSSNNKSQGILSSDLVVPNSRTGTPRSRSPAKSNNSNKIHIPIGSTVRPQSSILQELESAIRSLELTTNPTLPQNSPGKRITCNCMGQKHDLLAAAPNCLSCGKIICIKEGLGPCPFCTAPLLSSDETQEMIAFLRLERGHQKMSENNNAHRRPEVAKSPKPFSSTAEKTHLALTEEEEYEIEALKRAKAHRDKLLAFQAQNAKRTTIIDEQNDFDTSAIESGGYSGLNMWATPAERALQLKKQMKRMKELEWAAKPDYEKRGVFVSIDLTEKGKGVVVRREMRELEMKTESSDDETYTYGAADPRLVVYNEEQASADQEGKYSRNPLLKGLVRPIYKPRSSSNPETKEKGKTQPRGKSKRPKVNVGVPEEDELFSDYYDEEWKEELDENEILPDIVKARVEGVGKSGWRRILQDNEEVEGLKGG